MIIEGHAIVEGGAPTNQDPTLKVWESEESFVGFFDGISMNFMGVKANGLNRAMILGKKACEMGD